MPEGWAKNNNGRHSQSRTLLPSYVKNKSWTSPPFLSVLWEYYNRSAKQTVGSDPELTRTRAIRCDIGVLNLKLKIMDVLERAPENLLRVLK